MNQISELADGQDPTDLINRMLLLFHLAEFFQKEETKKYSDALRFLEEAELRQPDCLVLSAATPSYLNEPHANNDQKYHHLLRFSFIPKQKLGRDWKAKSKVLAIVPDSLAETELDSESEEDLRHLTSEFTIHEIYTEDNFIDIRIPPEFITVDNPSSVASLSFADIDSSILEIKAFMIWESYSSHKQSTSLLEVLSEYSRNEASKAVCQIIEKIPPTTVPQSAGFSSSPENLLDHAYSSISNLDNSYLPIQGPPGTGKTFLGSSVIRKLLKDGKRIAVTSQSWQVINNLFCATFQRFEEEGEHALLEEIVVHHRDTEPGRKFSDQHHEYAHYINKHKPPRGLYYGELDKDNPTGNPTWYQQKRNPSRREIADPPFPESGKDFHSEAQLLGANSFFLADSGIQQACREPEMKESFLFDYLFIDEAGQYSLAETLAIASIAKNIILLGDPKQLPQVTTANHLHNSGLSVLEHLLGKESNASPEQGYFLGETWRMRPEINNFISQEFYNDMLGTQEVVESRSIEGIRNGVYFSEVTHQDCQKESGQEAAEICRIIRSFVGMNYTEGEDAERLITEKDVIVLAPYGDQVSRIKEELYQKRIKGVKVGTVDKFQGKEAPIAVYSMTSSTPEDIPTGRYEFIFSPNRLNVAVSRAKCVAVIVASPDLVNTQPKSIVDMENLNHICRIFQDTKGTPPLSEAFL